MKITLEQWQTLITLVESGGYAKAAEKMNKSQSSISYSITKMEEKLGIAIFRIQGRKATLTKAGEALFKQANALLERARYTESLAMNYLVGHHSSITLAIDILFPRAIINRVLQAFAHKYPFIHVELHETALSDTEKMIGTGKADLTISAHESARFIGDFLMQIILLGVAHPKHPLHQLNRDITFDDLTTERQIVIRESSTQQQEARWLNAQKRYTVSTLSTSIYYAKECLGFAWYPIESIQDELTNGQLKRLPLERGGKRYLDTYLVVQEKEHAEPHVQYLAELIYLEVARSTQQKTRNTSYA